MAHSIWHNWMTNLARAIRPATKRTVRDARRWDLAAEHLEGRAMLSATAGVAAEVAHGKAVASPNVAGTWLVETDFGDGTAVLTQKGAKVTSVITVQGFPTFTTVGKFKAKSPNSISDSFKIATPEGKIPVSVTINFGESSNPTSFTGSVTVAGETASLTGTKQGSTAALPKAAAVPNIGGAWLLDLSSSLGQFEDVSLTINQTGKKITGNASFDGGSISFTGKVKPTGHIAGKATVVYGQNTLSNQKFFADLEGSTFSGEVNLKSLDEIINIDGVKVV